MTIFVPVEYFSKREAAKLGRARFTVPYQNIKVYERYDCYAGKCILSTMLAWSLESDFDQKLRHFCCPQTSCDGNGYEVAELRIGG